MTQILRANGSYTEIGFYCLFSFVCINTFLLIHRELQQAIGNWNEYRRDYENLVEVSLILSTLIYLIGMFLFDVDLIAPRLTDAAADTFLGQDDRRHGSGTFDGVVHLIDFSSHAHEFDGLVPRLVAFIDA